MNRISPKKILYGIQGEGRGHTSRSIQIIKQLKDRGHNVQVFGGGDALPLLQFNNISAIQIPIFRLYTGKKGGVDLWKIIFKNFLLFFGLLFGIGGKYRKIYHQVLIQNPDFIISDFEPYLLKIANEQKIPVILIDHQHFLTEAKIPPLKSLNEKIKLFLVKLFIKILSGKPDKIITSAFFHFPKKEDSRAIFVGPFLSDAVLNTKPSQGNHITIYLKEPFYLKKILPVIQNMQWTHFEVFSDWSLFMFNPGTSYHIKLINIHPQRFISSLASSAALICTAGNQVIGEAIYLGKPILAFPKLNDVEQKINGMALKQSGFGDSIEVSQFTENAIHRFLAQRNVYESKLMEHLSKAGTSYNGATVAIKMIEDFAIQQEFVDRRIVELKVGRIKIQYNRFNSKLGFSYMQ